MNETKIPPIGIMPKNIWQDKCKRERINDLLECLQRYADAGRPAMPEWIQELRELLS